MANSPANRSGHCGACLDTFLCSATLKGGGADLISSTFTDNLCALQVAFAKLYEDREALPITAAELLNDRVDPVLRRARDPALPGADRSRHRVLRQIPELPRATSFYSGDRGHRTTPAPRRAARKPTEFALL